MLGKYHPHGDSATYEALVRMAQDFSMRYTLIDGQGNFGSVDGDAAAAYRYTECRLEKISAELLADIGSRNRRLHAELRRQGARARGAADARAQPPGERLGIAVGMATNIPPHNLGEVVDACLHLLASRIARSRS